MRHVDETRMGGPGGRFQTTQWSVIRAAQTDDQTRRRMVVGNLMERYWRPVYSYLRYKGYDNEKAKDLTQGFFAEIVWGDDLLGRTDRSKGRFRTFLLTALQRYVVSVHRKENARKRRPAAGFVDVEMEELPLLATTRMGTAADETFYRSWASDLLGNVLSQVEAEYCRTGRDRHWRVFQAKVLTPILQDAEAPPLEEICKNCGVEDETKASNMIVTVKRRFQAVLRRNLRDLVPSEDEVDAEFHEILEIFSRQGAG
jgi:RNA polymerase sigma-70 factor (ECF subfamily)